MTSRSRSLTSRLKYWTHCHQMDCNNFDLLTFHLAFSSVCGQITATIKYHYLSINMLAWQSSSGNRTLRSYCKMKYLMSLLRQYPHLARRPLCLDLHSYSLMNPLPPTSYHLLRHFTNELKHLEVVRFYSSSYKNPVKAEAPIRIFKEAQNHFHLNSPGECLGQSFNQLSKHMNIYIKRNNVEPTAEYTCLTALEYHGRSQRCSHSHWAARETNISEGKDIMQTLEGKQQTTPNKQECSGRNPSTQENPGLQLFHISSLSTRFGESYSYVANHINSVFSLGFKKTQLQEKLESMSFTTGTNRMQKNRKIPNTCIINSEEAKFSQVQLHPEQATVESKNIPNSWEEGYLHFARHINKYFGAKVTDEVQNRRKVFSVEKNSTYKSNFSRQSTSQTCGATSQLKQEESIIPETGGLFHSSSNTTSFGENYFQMARHINHYFKGQSGLKEDIGRNLPIEMDLLSANYGRLKAVTFVDCFRHPTSAIPDFLRTYLKGDPFTQTSHPKPATILPNAVLNKKRHAEEMTRVLMSSLRLTLSPEALTACMEALNEHLIQYPSCKALMWQEKTAVMLLRRRRNCRGNQALQRALRETLALIGYVDPVKGRGIRVLSIDGGGTRGVVPLQVLKLLEEETGRKIHQLFDYICGVSTGAVLAFMLGLERFSLEECADMYRQVGSEVFCQNPLVGTMKMGWSHSYYDTETWETILREKLGTRVLIKTSSDELSPKVSAVSAVVNWGTSPKAFVFRNYNHKPGYLSRYAGGSGYELWQAVRASSAAPGYFQEFALQGDIHQDGGIILNNPCALAVHESRLLWPNQPFQCVLSLGTGRYDNIKRGPATSTSLRAKISNLVSSATDTEGVHTLLDDLLAPDVYFRFNPTLSAVVSLDESRPQVLDQLQRDTQFYLERNRLKLARLCLVLGAERSAVSRAKDWMSERAWEMKHKWV
ncbi:calcium-independent phospholipase A2-gamma-like isoform X2 [Mastacembelus armatus]|uniref:calcium-independent phospholipase A2-gamma-like isoform X2 n=1 Tax=Mastacembelus armatus TaxID=205130 RepID=UPI000E458D87|nr:calcium-independent phospholipase A2-gamma-like isoform X2 [Mastacembelus armatus]